jgi:hypothetical protein
MNGIAEAISFVGQILFELVGAVWSCGCNTSRYELLAILVGIGLVLVTVRGARS